MEQRRLRAARLFAVGKEKDGAIARRLGVSRQSIMRWHRAWMTGGRAALRAAGRAGRRPKLARQQLATVEAALRQGPVANGFQTELWTVPRVAMLIARVTGVQYHPGHVWRLLRAMEWTPQRPAIRARQRKETAIQARITQRWPAAKRAPGPSSKTRAASPSGRPSSGPRRRGGRHQS